MCSKQSSTVSRKRGAELQAAPRKRAVWPMPEAELDLASAMTALPIIVITPPDCEFAIARELTSLLTSRLLAHINRTLGAERQLCSALGQVRLAVAIQSGIKALCKAAEHDIERALVPDCELSALSFEFEYYQRTAMAQIYTAANDEHFSVPQLGRWRRVCLEADRDLCAVSVAHYAQHGTDCAFALVCALSLQMLKNILLMVRELNDIFPPPLDDADLAAPPTTEAVRVRIAVPRLPLLAPNYSSKPAMDMALRWEARQAQRLRKSARRLRTVVVPDSARFRAMVGAKTGAMTPHAVALVERFIVAAPQPQDVQPTARHVLFLHTEPDEQRTGVYYIVLELNFVSYNWRRRQIHRRVPATGLKLKQ